MTSFWEIKSRMYTSAQFNTTFRLSSFVLGIKTTKSQRRFIILIHKHCALWYKSQTNEFKKLLRRRRGRSSDSSFVRGVVNITLQECFSVALLENKNLPIIRQQNQDYIKHLHKIQFKVIAFSNDAFYDSPTGIWYYEYHQLASQFLQFIYLDYYY